MHTRRMILRGLTAVAAAVLAIGLTACSGSGASDSKTLTIMFWGDQTAKKHWQDIATAFQKDGHKDVTFKYIVQPDQYETKLQTLIAAGDEPDVFMLNTDFTKQFYDKGAVLDLDPQFKKLGVDVDKEFLPQSVWRENGKVISLASQVDTVVMYYNKKAFDNAGIAHPSSDAAHPWTWSQFADAAAKLSSGSGSSQKWGGFISYNLIPWTPLISSNGGSWFNSDASKFALNSDKAEQVLQNIKKLSDSGAIVPQKSVSSIGWDIVLQSKKAAMFLDGTWNTQTIMDAWGKDAGMAVLPAFNKFSSMIITDQIVAGSKTKNPKLAAEFVHFAAQAKNNPESLLRLPASASYSQGSDRKAWLAAANRPEGFEQTLTTSVANAVRLPSTQTSAFPLISSKVGSNALDPYFAGKVTDLSAALDKVAPDVDKALATK